MDVSRLVPSAARQVFAADFAPHLVAYAHAVAMTFPDPGMLADQMFAMSGPVSALTLSASGNVSIIEGMAGDRPDFLYARGHRSLGWFRDRLHLLDTEPGHDRQDVMVERWAVHAQLVPATRPCTDTFTPRDVVLVTPPVARAGAGILIVGSLVGVTVHGWLWTPGRGVQPGQWLTAAISQRGGLVGHWAGALPPDLPNDPREALPRLATHE